MTTNEAEYNRAVAFLDTLIARSDRVRETRRKALEEAFDMIDTRIEPKLWESIERLSQAGADRDHSYTVNGQQAVHMAIPLAHFLLGEGLEMRGPEAGKYVSRPKRAESGEETPDGN